MMDIEIITKLLFQKYGKVVLTPEEVASILGASPKSLERDRLNAIGIPFTRRNNKERGQVFYTITAVAKTLIENQKKVF